MTDAADELKKAGVAYKRARERADKILEGPRDELAAQVRAAYSSGMRKVDILRAIDYVWSRQWLDDVVRDLPAPIRPPSKRAGRRSPAPAGE